MPPFDLLTHQCFANHLFLFDKQCRDVLGAQRHGCHAMFKKYSRQHFGSVLLFIKPLACRMAGFAIQLLRIFRLKNVLLQCFSDPVFLALPVEFQKFSAIMKQDSYWELHFAVIQLLYPLYRLLRLADMRIGGMDGVKFFILQQIN